MMSLTSRMQCQSIHLNSEAKINTHIVPLITTAPRNTCNSSVPSR